MLFNEYLREKPVGVDTSELKKLVNDAKEKLENVKASAYGIGLSDGELWVTEEVYDSYQFAIRCAEIVANDSIATKEEVDKAKNDLVKMGILFKRKIKETS